MTVTETELVDHNGVPIGVQNPLPVQISQQPNTPALIVATGTQALQVTNNNVQSIQGAVSVEPGQVALVTTITSTDEQTSTLLLAQAATLEMMKAIVVELQAIRQLIADNQPGIGD